MEGSAGRKALIVVVFGLMIVAFGLVMASGAGRFGVDDPKLMWLGLGAFAVAAVIGLITRAARPQWKGSEGLTPTGMVVLGVALVVACVVAIVVLIL